MDMNQQTQGFASSTGNYRFNSFYCHPDFLAGMNDCIVKQVFGTAEAVTGKTDKSFKKPAEKPDSKNVD